MKTLLRLSLAGALLGATAAFATNADDTYSLMWAPKEGDTATYQMSGTITMDAGEGQIKQKMTDKVTKVEADGTYTVQVTNTEGLVTMSGMEIPLPETSATSKYKADKTLVSIAGDTVNASVYRVSNLNGFVAPGKPVAVGDTWTVDIPANPNGSVHVIAKFKLDSIEKVGDQDALKIVGNLKEAEGDAPGSIDKTYWVSKTDFTMLKDVSKWKDVSVAGAPGPVSGTFTTVRLPDAK